MISYVCRELSLTLSLLYILVFDLIWVSIHLLVGEKLLFENAFIENTSTHKSFSMEKHLEVIPKEALLGAFLERAFVTQKHL